MSSSTAEVKEEIMGILLLICLIILRIVPEAVSLVIFYKTNYVYKDKKNARTLFSILLIIISGTINFIVYFVIHNRLRNDWNIQKTIVDICKLQFSYQDITYFSSSLIICTLYAIFFGYVLKYVLSQVLEHKYITDNCDIRRKTLLLLLSVVSIAAISFYGVYTSADKKIVINEICSKNLTVTLDENGMVSDYVEIYNNGLLPYQIEKLYLSDDVNELTKFEIPAGLIESKGYQVIFLDKYDSFGISGSGETLYLSDHSGEIIDQVTCTALDSDMCYCRVSDGGSRFAVKTCTPGANNLNANLVISAPVFSYASGFYTDEFDLTISSEHGTAIFYTLDGSIPSTESIVYDGPIHIGDASSNTNIWSMSEDISTGFLVGAYQAPSYLIDKCTVIRAICVDKNNNTSVVSSASYFVNFTNKDGYDGMNILSIITDPDNLFNYNTGIYVRGQEYDAHAPYDENPYWWWWDSNYHQRGRDWEREAYLQFFDQKGHLILEKSAGMRVQGGGSRGLIPRSFNLYARKVYDGNNRFEADFFGNNYEPQRVTLFAGGDDNQVKLKDYLMASMISNRNFSTMDFSPYVMFLDGEYWGVYWLTEKYDEEYFKYHYDVDNNNVIMIKNDVLALGSDTDQMLYNEMRDFIINSDLSVSDNYQRACELIDINSCIDYYAAEIYIARYNDWPMGNFALWRTRNLENTSYSDGKWRWILFDVNSGGMDSQLIKEDTLTATLEKDSLFASLMRNDEFKRKFITTILDMANNEFLPENICNFIDDFNALMKIPLSKEYERFCGINNLKLFEFDSKIVDAKNFFNGRHAYIMDYFGKLIKTVQPDNNSE